MAKSKPTPATPASPPPAVVVGTDGTGEVVTVELAPPADDDTAEIVVPPPAEVEPTPPAVPAPVARDHGFGTWLVHTPGHTAARTVRAASEAEAVDQYKALMGITTLPAAAVAERVADTPAE